MRGWLWMARRFGIRRTVWYWQQGQQRGWQTKEEGEAFFHEWTEGAGQTDRERYQLAMAAVRRIRARSN